MEIFGFLAVIATVVVVALMRNRKEDRKTIEELQGQLAAEKQKAEEAERLAAEKQQVPQEKPRTRDLFLETLTKMGCKYEFDEENRICFQWQGGYFVGVASNESLFVTVWYFQWGEWELYDIDMLSRVKRVINDANICYSLNVVYSINEEGGSFFIHSNKSFLFIPQIPDIKGYLEAMLGEFFIVRRYVEKELDKLENQEEKISK
ncbi:MAG: hypothetical protein J5965_28590 [Aeriscardovia sp.]|nr:hypothetical protein [Aeriscardovia sp.]